MKKLLLLFSFLCTFAAVNAQTARVQIIHNSADDAAAEVDVYLNDGLAVDNFAFRTSTGFIDLQELDKGNAEFAAELLFAENRLEIRGAKDGRVLKLHAVMPVVNKGVSP